MLKATITERRKIRTIVLSGLTEIHVEENDDGTWFAGVGPELVIEAESAAAVLRELALILEES